VTSKVAIFNDDAQTALLNYIAAQNNLILRGIQLLVAQGAKTTMDLSQLTTDVANETTVMQSAEALITGLAAQITAAGTDPVALKALTSTMETNAGALGQAVAAQTPPAAAAAVAAFKPVAPSSSKPLANAPSH
jgi:hypothetical protein